MKRKILITGGSHGMGRGLATVLAENKNHEIILLCRSVEAAQTAIKQIKSHTGNDSISFVLCDLSKFSDVKHIISEIKNLTTYLDAIFINAGLGYAAKQIITDDGLDSHFQINYLSQFMLTLHLLSLLKASSDGGRIIFNATNFGQIYWNDMQLKTNWSYEKSIFQAMAAKRMFVHKLHRHLHRENESEGLASLNPSVISYHIHKTVWTNQINIIPFYMRTVANVVRFFGGFLTEEECGHELAPLFTEDKKVSIKRSGHLTSSKNESFIFLKENEFSTGESNQDKLWEASLRLCNDQATYQIANELTKKK